MCASIVARGDAPPVFQFGEHVLDLMALAMEGFIIVEWLLAAFGWRDTGYGALISQRVAEPGAIVAAIGKQSGCLWQAGQ
jgi:hypothetical protein